MESFVQFVIDGFDSIHWWTFETLVQPALVALGLSRLLEDAYDATMWLLIGLFELGFMVLVFGALERWRPVEPLTDRHQVRVDLLYTLIHRLGLFRLALYFTLLPLVLWVTGWLHVHGFALTPVDQIWPGVTDHAWVSLLIYLLIFDFVDYLYHRLQHGWPRLWALHAVHHSQRQMTMFSDNRNHLVDDFLRSLVLVTVSFLVGVAPGQFILIVILTQLLESLSHSNVRLDFGRMFSRVLVSPKYHRHHHAIVPGKVSPGQASGYNFAVLFPFWDMLFGTARFDGSYAPTGIHDQLEHAGARDYGRTFWAQQWIGLKNMFSRG